MEYNFDDLTRNEMEETGDSIDGLPVIRQLPGQPKNSFGLYPWMHQVK